MVKTLPLIVTCFSSAYDYVNAPKLQMTADHYLQKTFGALTKTRIGLRLGVALHHLTSSRYRVEHLHGVFFILQ